MSRGIFALLLLLKAALVALGIGLLYRMIWEPRRDEAEPNE